VAVALIISFLFLAQYSRKETVVGYLTPISATSKIFVPQLGTIREIHVNEGQQVREGQTLLTIDTNQIAANDLDVNATVLDTPRSQKNRLTGQICSGGTAHKVRAGAPDSHDRWARDRKVSASGAAQNSG